jgi:hypothetical protein
MEGTLYLVELAMIGAGCAAALASLFTFGGATRNRAGLFALGLYLLALGSGCRSSRNSSGRSRGKTMPSSDSSFSRCFWCPSG